MKLKLGRIAGISVLALLMAFVSACGGGTAQPAAGSGTSAAPPQEAAGANDQPYKGEKLVVGIWGGGHVDVITKNVIKPLEAKGAQIELVLGGTPDRVSKLYAEKGNPTMDVAFVNIYEAKQLIQDGAAEDVDPSLPNFNSLYPAAQKNGYGMSFMAVGIAYNKDLVKEPITSWKDLWRADLRGKVAFPSFPGFEGESFLAMTGRAFGRTEQDFRANFDKLKELKPLPMVYSNMDEVFIEMKNGSVLAFPFFNSYVNQYVEKGFPVGFVYPDDGPVMAKNTIVIAKGTKHEKLAKEFVSLAISKQTQEDYANVLFYGPVNKEVKLSDAVAAKLVYGPEAVEKLVSLDWDYMISKRSEFSQIWNREILGND